MGARRKPPSDAEVSFEKQTRTMDYDIWLLDSGDSFKIKIGRCFYPVSDTRLPFSAFVRHRDRRSILTEFIYSSWRLLSQIWCRCPA